MTQFLRLLLENHIVAMFDECMLDKTEMTFLEQKNTREGTENSEDKMSSIPNETVLYTSNVRTSQFMRNMI